MAAAEDQSSTRSRSAYTCTGATVGGLPTHGVFKSEYFIKVIIDGQGGWETRGKRTKGSTVVWDAEEDKHDFQCARTSTLQVTLCKNHGHSRSVEEVGSVALPLNLWMEALMVARLITSTTAKDAPSITVQLSLTQEDDTLPESAVALEEPVESADTDGTAAALHPTIPGLDAVTAAMETVDNATEVVTDIGSALEGLLDTLDVFIRLGDVLSEVHPYVKMSWTILFAVLKAAKAQRDRDKNMKDLIEKMKNVYDFLCDAQELRNDKARMGVLSRLALQTVDCAHFISSCIKKTNFITRLVKQSVSSVNDKIDQYSSSFEELFRDFQNGSQLRTEIATTLILDDLRDLTVDIDLRDIPYAGGAGYEPSRQCLEDTRTALLEEISIWAIDDAEDTPGLFILMGRAGTGKSTIAHTMAARFRKMQRLGASFCFSTSSTRKPVNLFRNIARDLASFHPAFRVALRNAVGRDASLCTTEDLRLQFEKFILEPAQSLAVSGTVLVMVDGFDESGTDLERKALLAILCDRLNELPTAFRFLITSRNENDVQTAFPKSAKHAVVKTMPTLDEDKQLREDILKYIRHSLPKDGIHSFSDRSCATLADKSEGLFQWASVACSYITRPRMNQTPMKRYDLVTSPGNTGLDSLYKAVLSQILQPDPMFDDEESTNLFAFRTIMGTVLTAVEPLSMGSLRTLYSFLPEVSVDVDGVLGFLGSLLSGVGEDKAPVRPLHSSFGEMLRSSKRGGDYCVGTDGHHEHMATASLRLLGSRLHFNMGGLETSYMLNRAAHSLGRSNMNNVTEDLSYACRHWGYHLSMCALGYERDVFDLVECLFKKKFLFWLDAASIAEAVSDTANCITLATGRLQNLGDDIFELAQDGLRFITVFAKVISESAAHIYLSALVWAPSNSAIAKTYRSVSERTALVVSGQVAWWPTLVLSIFPDSKTNCVAFSPDRRKIVSGSENGDLCIWDAHTGVLVGEQLKGHEAEVRSVAFSPDGTRIVSGSKDRTLRVWNVQTGEQVREPLTGHEDEVNSVAFSPDGTRIVSGSNDKTLRLWNVQTGEQVREPMTGHEASVSSVVFSLDGMLIVSGSNDPTVRLWDPHTGEPIRKLLTHHSWDTPVALSPDGTRIVVGGSEDLSLWDVRTGEQVLAPLTGHQGKINAVAFSPNGKHIASGSDDGTVRLWNAHTGEPVGGPLTTDVNASNTFSFLNFGRWVKSVAFSPDGMHLVSNCYDSAIYLWDVRKREDVQEPLIGHERGVTSVAFSPDGTRILSASKDKTVRLWDANTGQAVLEPLTGHTESVTSIAFSSDGTHIVSGSEDETVRLWDAHTGEPVLEPLTKHKAAVRSVAFSPDGTRILSGAADRSLRLWDAQTGEPALEPLWHRARIMSVAFSADGSRMLSTSRDEQVNLWNAHNGWHINRLDLDSYSFEDDGMTCTAFSPDGTWVVAGYGDKSVRLWDARTREHVLSLTTGHKAAVTSVAVSPDGTRIASGAADWSVRVWDARTGEPVMEPLFGHVEPVNSVAFSPDGTRIVSGSDDRSIRVWDARNGTGMPIVAVSDAHERGSSDDETILDSSEPVQSSCSSAGDGTRLTLSPLAEHQLTQPYRSATSPDESRISLLETGWVMGNGTDRILWVPPDQMERLYTGQMRVVIPGPTIHVDLSRFVHGTEWVKWATVHEARTL